jgi:hypothetical protein
MPGMEHDEAIPIYALQMRARRLLRRPATAGLLAMTTPRFFNSPKNRRTAINVAVLVCPGRSIQRDMVCREGANPLSADQLASDLRRINSVQRNYKILRARIDELEGASRNAWILRIDQIDHYESSCSGLMVTYGHEPIRIISALFDTSLLNKAAPEALPIESNTLRQNSEEVTQVLHRRLCPIVAVESFRRYPSATYLAIKLCNQSS